MLEGCVDAGRPGWYAPQALQSNWKCLAVWFALGHGCATTPLQYASSVLHPSVANIGNAVLYSATVTASLVLAAPTIGVVGSKGSLILGMALHFAYCGFFSFAAVLGNQAKGAALDLQWALFVLGSCCGGVGAGVMWTAEGVYFSRTVDLLSGFGEPLGMLDGGQASRKRFTGQLAGTFALLLLILEVGSKLSWSVLQVAGMVVWQVGIVYSVLTAVAACQLGRLLSLDKCGDRDISDGVASRRPIVANESATPGSDREPPLPTARTISSTSIAVSKFRAVISLWNDPVIFLISGCNLTFGFLSALMNGLVNGHVATRELGPQWLGALSGLTAAIAALCVALSHVMAKRAGKGVVVLLGSCCAMGVPFCLMVLRCCDGWGAWLVILYVLLGNVRAVYESTNRGVFSDFFPGRRAEAAFANCMLQSSFASTISFLLQEVVGAGCLAAITLALAMITSPAYGSALAVRNWQCNDQFVRSLSENSAPGTFAQAGAGARDSGAVDCG